jgi:hypothetical protein
MRRLLLAALLTAAVAAHAQAPSKPQAVQPVPQPAAPPPGMELDPFLEPQVTIIRRGTDTVEEYRIGGKLYMLKVTPPNGAPYYLIDEQGDGRFSRQNTLDSGIRPPMWVIKSF